MKTMNPEFDEILIVGGYTRPICASCKKLGYRISSIDFFNDMDLLKVCDKHTQISKEDIETKLEGLIEDHLTERRPPIIFTSPYENYPEITSKFEKKTEVFNNTTKVMKKSREISAYKRLTKYVKCPKTKLISDFSDLKNIDETEYLIKPQKSGGGVGIDFYKNQSDFPFIAQEYIQGTPMSSFFVSDGKNVNVLSINKQIIGNEEFGAKKFMFSGVILPYENDEIFEATIKIAQDLGLKGLNGIDFVKTEEDIYFIEVNPRITFPFEIFDEFSDVNMIKTHIDAFDSKIYPINCPKYCMKVILYAKNDYTSKLNPDKFIRDVEKSGTRINKGKPICSILAKADSIQNLKEVINTKSNDIYEH